MTKTIIASLISGAIAALVVVGILAGTGASPKLGAQVQNDLFWFTGGIKVGGTGQLAISATGVITSSVANAWSALNTFTAGLRAGGSAPVVQTGSKTVLTSSSTVTLTGTQICSSRYFEWQPTGAASTATLPTAAQLTCLTTNGDTIGPIVFKNTSTAASTTVFAAGASTTINYATSSASSASAVAGGNLATLWFVMASSSDPTSGVNILVNQYK